MNLETIVVHLGQEHDEFSGAVIPPIYATSTFAQSAPGETKGYDYTRSGNPNFSNLETTLAAVENARFSTVFASGMAAITAVLSTLKAGDLVVAEENIYGCTYRILDQVFDKFGVSVEYYDFTERESLDAISAKEPAIVWIESPTNPLLKVIDIKTVAERAKAAGSILVVDNTFASPCFQRPLDLGADLSLSSSTKYINGHSDCLGGVVATNSEEWRNKMIFAQKAVGLNPSPIDAWLISRGVKTMPLRMAKHHENALAFAKFLESHGAVKMVRYPYLECHPQYELAVRQMSGGSGIVTANFDLSIEETKQLVGKFKLFTLAESLGGVESLVCHPASMTHAAVPASRREEIGISDGLVRFSVGIENSHDLIADFNQGLDRVSRGI